MDGIPLRWRERSLHWQLALTQCAQHKSDSAKFWGISWGTFLPHLGKLGRKLAAWAALEPPCRLDQKYPKPPCRDDQNPPCIEFPQVSMSQVSMEHKY